MPLPAGLFLLPEAAKIAGLSLASAVEFTRRGLVPVAAGGGVQGRDRRLDDIGVVSLCVVRELRRRGLSRASIKRIVAGIAECDVDMLRRAIRDRRTVLVAADQSPPALVLASQLPALVAKSTTAIVCVIPSLLGLDR